MATAGRFLNFTILKSWPMTEPTKAWHEIVLETLKSNDVTLIVYVPDRVFTPLIKAFHADALHRILWFMAQPCCVGQNHRNAL